MKTCKRCKKEIAKTSPRANNVKFCSVKCRNKVYYVKKGGAEFQREYLAKKREEKYSDLLRCEFCGKGFRQLGSHVFHTHKMTARQYKKETGQDLNKGLLTKDLKKLKSDYAYEYEMPKQLKITGKETRFKKGHGINYERSPETMRRLKKHWSRIKEMRWNNSSGGDALSL